MDTIKTQKAHVDDVDYLFSEKMADALHYNTTEDVLMIDVSQDPARFSQTEGPNEVLKLRSYQEELAQPALNGENSIVCAPTGSGKTLVAIAVIKNHLQEKPDGKVLFFVPTVELVKQQCDGLKKYLGANTKIVPIRGGSTAAAAIPKLEVIKSHQVIVLTPAIMLNMLCSDAEDGRLFLSDFTLLVFDEVHHGDKSHPYSEIMTVYLDLKINNETMENKIPLPQVLGLTASLGTNKANGEEDALLFALQLCARMDAQRLCRVEKNLEEMEQFVNVPRDEMVQVGSYPNKPFESRILLLMKLIESKVCPEITANITDSPAECVADKTSPGYTNFVHVNKRRSAVLRDAVTKRRILTYLEHLERYHNSLVILEHVPADRAFQYLETEMEEFIRRKTTDTDDFLIQQYRVHQPYLQKIAASYESSKVPLSEKLKEILEAEYEVRPSSRTLVFVRTRELTIALVDFIKTQPSIASLCPARLVGSNISADKGGQAAAVKKEIMEKFRSGDHKVLVATSVAEEGLDIQSCALVIKYNHVTNETAMIQKRGRGRAENSRSILLVQKSHLADKEMINMFRELLMNKAVDRIQKMPLSDYRLKIYKLQTEEKKRREIMQLAQADKKRRLGNRKYHLLCKKCDNFCVASENVKHTQATHYTCVDPKIWERCDVAPIGSKMQFFEMLIVAGKVFCGECKQDWGLVVKYRNAFLPALKIDYFVIEQADNKKNRITRRKWKQVVENFFVVDETTSHDIINMIKAARAPLKLDIDIDRAKAASLLASNSLSEDLVSIGSSSSFDSDRAVGVSNVEQSLTPESSIGRCSDTTVPTTESGLDERNELRPAAGADNVPVGSLIDI